MKKGFSFKAERGALLPYCFFNSNSFFISSDETGVTLNMDKITVLTSLWVPGFCALQVLLAIDQDALVLVLGEKH